MKETAIHGGPLSEFGKQATHQPSWDDARIFLAIARAGTLSGAAAALGLGLATVSRRLDRLETALAVPLFSRHQSGYRLTDDGTALVPRAEALEQAGHAFGEAARGQGQVCGHVRLATAENLATSLIVPSLPALFARHPGLQVDVVTDVRTINLHRRDADLAVRMIKPERGHLTTHRLGTLGFGLYGTPAYLDTRARSEERAGFEEDDFIGWTEDYSHLPAAQWIERCLRGRPCRLRTTTLTAQISAVSAGLGLAILPHSLARPAGFTCLSDDLGVDQPIWLAVHSDLIQSARVRAVADHLTGVLLDRRMDLRGRP